MKKLLAIMLLATAITGCGSDKADDVKEDIKSTVHDIKEDIKEDVSRFHDKVEQAKEDFHEGMKEDEQKEVTTITIVTPPDYNEVVPVGFTESRDELKPVLVSVSDNDATLSLSGSLVVDTQPALAPKEPAVETLPEPVEPEVLEVEADSIEIADSGIVEQLPDTSVAPEEETPDVVDDASLWGQVVYQLNAVLAVIPRMENVNLEDQYTLPKEVIINGYKYIVEVGDGELSLYEDSQRLHPYLHVWQNGSFIGVNDGVRFQFFDRNHNIYADTGGLIAEGTIGMNCAVGVGCQNWYKDRAIYNRTHVEFYTTVSYKVDNQGLDIVGVIRDEDTGIYSVSELDGCLMPAENSACSMHYVVE